MIPNPMLKRAVIFLLHLITVVPSINAQINTFDTKKYSVAELQEDFNYLRKYIQDKGTVIYLYNTKKETDDYLDSVYKCITEPMTGIEFFRLIAPVQAFFKDVHTSITPGAPIRKTLFENQHLFPLEIELIDQKVFIEENYSSNSNLDHNQEIISINGISMDSIIHKCSLILPREGYDTGHPLFWLNGNFFYYYYFTYGPSETYTLELKTNEGSTTQMETISGINLETFWAIDEERNPVQNELNIYTQVNDSLRTVTLTINTFDNNDIKANHQSSSRKVIDEQFDLILKTGYSNLIIDIRDNDGGKSSNGAQVLRYLLNSPFKIKQSVRVVKNKHQEDLMKRTRPALYGQFERGTYRPHKRRFNGDVYVLMNAGSTSAAVVFAAALDRQNRATFIGTEMGGNPIVMGGGLWDNVKETPNTKISFSFADKCSILNNLELNNGHGLIPDFTIDKSYEDFILDYDRIMLFTLKLIENK